MIDFKFPSLLDIWTPNIKDDNVYNKNNIRKIKMLTNVLNFKLFYLNY